MDLSENRVAIAIVAFVGMGALLAGAVYALDANTSPTDRVLSIDAVPLQAEGDASFALRTENGRTYVETEPPGANITYPETTNYTSLDFRQKPAVRVADLDVDEGGVAETIDKAASEDRVYSISFEGEKAKRIESQLNSTYDSTFVVFSKDDRAAVYLQYTITE